MAGRRAQLTLPAMSDLDGRVLLGLLVEPDPTQAISIEVLARAMRRT